MNMHSVYHQLLRHIPKYKYERERIKTFENWPKNAPQFIDKLAKTGFIYTGIGDHTRCVYCGILMGEWLKDDDPDKDHFEKSFGICPFFDREWIGGNIPIESERKYKDEFPLLRRLKIFIGWEKH